MFRPPATPGFRRAAFTTVFQTAGSRRAAVLTRSIEVRCLPRRRGGGDQMTFLNGHGGPSRSLLLIRCSFSEAGYRPITRRRHRRLSNHDAETLHAIS